MDERGTGKLGQRQVKPVVAGAVEAHGEVVAGFDQLVVVNGRDGEREKADDRQPASQRCLASGSKRIADRARHLVTDLVRGDELRRARLKIVHDPVGGLEVRFVSEVPLGGDRSVDDPTRRPTYQSVRRRRGVRG